MLAVRMFSTYTRLALQLVGSEVIANELLVEAGLVLSQLDGRGPEARAIRGPISRMLVI